MGRKKKNRGLPTNIYNYRKRYHVQIKEGGHLNYYGAFKTLYEAMYHKVLVKNNMEHHWSGMERGAYFGFIYKITNLKTGKAYIGSKQFYRWVGPQGGYKCTDPSDPWWDESMWAPNDWESYTSSSIPLNTEIANMGRHCFSYEVVKMCRDRLDLHLSEINLQVESDVLEARKDGDYLYYNENIGRVAFRAPFIKEDMKEKQWRTYKEMKRYYLKPQLDSEGKVIPYEDRVR